MNLLLHVCCGPCSIYPVSIIQKAGISFSAYFFNPNIHPFKEFKSRINALAYVSNNLKFNLILEKDYELKEYLRQVVFHENNRCNICYDLRLRKSVEYAVAHNFDAFSTTLLYSKYQNHNLIIDTCNQLSKQFGIEFFYRDFRKGWQYGIDQSKKLDIYRQRYCGCIYSEHEAFDKRFRKKIRSKTLLEHPR
jgi:hypothetical protein